MLRRVHGRDMELRIAGTASCPPESEAEVLRVAQEALNNALRHAEAERVELRMEVRDGRLVVAGGRRRRRLRPGARGSDRGGSG